MNVKTISFPVGSGRRKQKPTPVPHLPINNQRHHPASSLQKLHASSQDSSSSEAFFPIVSTVIGGSLKPRPYHLNDFANNHLFLAKRKIAQAFDGQPTRNAQSTTDLLYLFDQQESKSKNRHTNKPKRQGSLISRTVSFDQDAHVSVVNLHVSPPYSSTQNRDRLSTGLIRPFDLWSGVKDLSLR